MFWPSIHPSSCIRARNAATSGIISLSLNAEIKPTSRFLLFCCARATAGHTTEPPSSKVNSRRLMFASRLRTHRLNLAHQKEDDMPPRTMSALGHKQTYPVQNSMSALLPIADIRGASRNVRYGPIADV